MEEITLTVKTGRTLMFNLGIALCLVEEMKTIKCINKQKKLQEKHKAVQRSKKVTIDYNAENYALISPFRRLPKLSTYYGILRILNPSSV